MHRGVILLISIVFITGCTHTSSKENPSTIELEQVHDNALFSICKSTQRYIQKDISLQNDCVPNGKGIFINAHGYGLTAKHVVDDVDRTYSILQGNDSYPIYNIWHHPTQDIALVWTDISSIEYGTIASSLGGKAIYSIEHTTQRTGSIIDANGGILTTNYLLKPGDSGTPLFSSTHELLGIVTAIDEEKKQTKSVSVVEEDMHTWLLDLSNQSP